MVLFARFHIFSVFIPHFFSSFFSIFVFLLFAPYNAEDGEYETFNAALGAQGATSKLKTLNAELVLGGRAA